MKKVKEDLQKKWLNESKSISELTNEEINSQYEIQENVRQLDALKKKYDELTDENQHGEAALALTQVLGDSDEVELIKAINARHKKRGNISKGEQTLRDEIANAHYRTMKQGLFPMPENELAGVSLDDYLERFEVGDTVLPKEEGPGQAPGKCIKVDGDKCTVKFSDGSTEVFTHDELEATDAKNLPEDDTADYEKVMARQVRKHIADIRFDVAEIEDKISQLAEKDNGDLTDQITTMKKYSDGLYAVLSRAMKIVPVYEDTDLEEDLTFENYALAAAEAHKAGKKEFEYPKGSGKMHKVTISPAAAKKITDEGYSKHKKGTKKYKQHMAAMHAAKAGR